MNIKKSKKIYFILFGILLLSLVILLLLMDWDKKKIMNLVESDIVFDENQEIVLSTEYQTYNKDIMQFTYFIENMTENEFTFGKEYSLEVKLDDTWYQIPYKADAAWIAIGYILPPRASSTDTIDLSIFDYQFTDGEYRIVKSIGNKYYYTTFILGQSNISQDTPFGYVDIGDVPKEYSIDDAKKDGVIIFSLDGDYNIDKIDNFFNKIERNANTMLRIMYFTEEGDPIIQDVIYENNYNGRYHLRVDSTRDKFAAPSNEIKDSYFSYAITDNEQIYLSNCVSLDLLEKNEYLDTPYLLFDKSKLLNHDAIDRITNITKNSMEHNITRYKKFNLIGDCYAIISDKSDNDEYFGFGYDNLGRGVIEDLIDSQSIVTNIYGIEWINNKQFVLLCKTSQKVEYYAIYDIAEEKITFDTYGTGYGIENGQIIFLE